MKKHRPVVIFPLTPHSYRLDGRDGFILKDACGDEIIFVPGTLTEATEFAERFQKAYQQHEDVTKFKEAEKTMDRILELL